MKAFNFAESNVVKPGRNLSYPEWHDTPCRSSFKTLAARLPRRARVLNSPARCSLPFSDLSNSRESRVASNASHKR